MTSSVVIFVVAMLVAVAIQVGIIFGIQVAYYPLVIAIADMVTLACPWDRAKTILQLLFMDIASIGYITCGPKYIGVSSTVYGNNP